MQRKIFAFCVALSMICFIPKSHAQKGKSEIALGYGYFSIYSLYNGSPYGTSGGVPTLTYRYYLTRDVTLGLGMGIENLGDWGSFVTIAPEVTATYLDTRNDDVRVRLYGALSYGIAIFDDYQLQQGIADGSGVKAYGFQITPLGLRIGRQFAGFVEVGVGYKGLVNGGLAVRFPRTMHKHHAAE